MRRKAASIAPKNVTGGDRRMGPRNQGIVLGQEWKPGDWDPEREQMKEKRKRRCRASLMQVSLNE